MRTVFWEYNELKMIDQRRLPNALEIVAFQGYKEVAKAIRDMVVRGAPAIGAAGAFGLALAAQESTAASTHELMTEMEEAAEVLKSARPTAVNLAWAIHRVMKKVNENAFDVEGLRRVMLDEAQKIAD
jgi:methylthioribose-1-phosphate isomerase